MNTSEHLTDETFVEKGHRLFGVSSFSALTLKNCRFESCSFGYNSSLFKAKDTLSDSELINCRVSKCLVGRAIVRRTSVTDLSGDMLICRGTFFDQVVLSGKISPMILHGVHTFGLSKSQTALLESERQAFYSNVEYALDISNAEFVDFGIRAGAIPTRLVRRDNMTQFVVENLEGVLSVGAIDGLGISELSKMVLKLMLEENQPDTILIAPKADDAVFESVMQDSLVLRKIGLISAG